MPQNSFTVLYVKVRLLHPYVAFIEQENTTLIPIAYKGNGSTLFW